MCWISYIYLKWLEEQPPLSWLSKIRILASFEKIYNGKSSVGDPLKAGHCPYPMPYLIKYLSDIIKKKKKVLDTFNTDLKKNSV